LVPLQVLRRQVAILTETGNPKYEAVRWQLLTAIEVLGTAGGEFVHAPGLKEFEIQFKTLRKLFTDPASTFINRTTSDVMARYNLDYAPSDNLVLFPESKALALYHTPMAQPVEPAFGALVGDMLSMPSLSRNVSTSASYAGIVPPPKYLTPPK